MCESNSTLFLNEILRYNENTMKYCRDFETAWSSPVPYLQGTPQSIPTAACSFLELFFRLFLVDFFKRASWAAGGHHQAQVASA